MYNIKMEKWQNGSGVTLRFTHPNSPGRTNVISLDFVDVERLHSMLEDYKNAPSPFKMIEGPETEPCQAVCSFRLRTQFGQWACNNCPRVWSAPDRGRTLEPSEIARFLFEKKTERECPAPVSKITGNTCHARTIQVFAVGNWIHLKCRGCGHVEQATCASCDQPATTTHMEDTVCRRCQAGLEAGADHRQAAQTAV